MTGHTHKSLCHLAVKWLKRPASQSGHGCTFASAEPSTGMSGEIPDAFGYRCSDFLGGSVVVEVKVGRGDFLADKKKPHRQVGGMGDYRYYLCPTGLIQVHDLPPGWGLIWVNPRGHIKVMAGAALAFREGYDTMIQQLAEWRQVPDFDRERALMAKMLSLVSDPDQVNQWLRESAGAQAKLQAQVVSLIEERRATAIRHARERADLRRQSNFEPDALAIPRTTPRAVNHG